MTPSLLNRKNTMAVLLALSSAGSPARAVQTMPKQPTTRTAHIDTKGQADKMREEMIVCLSRSGANGILQFKNGNISHDQMLQRGRQDYFACKATISAHHGMFFPTP